MNVIWMIRSLFTPMSVAVSGSCATARMPRPVRVRRMNQSVATIRSTDAITMISCWLFTIVPKTSKIGCATNMVTAGSAFAPRIRKIPYWMANEAPMAVMRNTRRGALRLRSGRYATRSSSHAVTADASMPTMSASKRSPMMAPGLRFGALGPKPSVVRVTTTP